MSWHLALCARWPLALQTNSPGSLLAIGPIPEKGKLAQARPALDSSLCCVFGSQSYDHSGRSSSPAYSLDAFANPMVGSLTKDWGRYAPESNLLRMRSKLRLLTGFLRQGPASNVGCVESRGMMASRAGTRALFGVVFRVPRTCRD